MSQEMKANFFNAEKLVNDSRVQVPETLKMKLYGLAKQAKEGDCKMPQPPASNVVLRAKWESWTGCAGMPIERAMQDYIELVNKLEPHAHNATAETIQIHANTKALPNGGGAQSNRKSGMLYKKRDMMKGWRIRHFVLEGNTLQYYIDADDTTPRGSLDIAGCSITSEKPVTVDGNEIYPFVIVTPKPKHQYYLASDNKLDADVWIAKLLDIASSSKPADGGDANEPESVSPMPKSSVYSKEPSVTTIVVPSVAPLSGGESSKGDSTVGGAVPAHYQADVANAGETRAFTPKEVVEVFERTAVAMMAEYPTDAPEWELLYDKPNYLVKKKPHQSIIIGKVESLLNYSLLDVFKAITNPKAQREIDPGKSVYNVLKRYSNHTWVEYTQFRAIWPASSRDFVSVGHWRMLQDGTVLVIIASDPAHDHLKPCEEGRVRGNVRFGGFVMKSTDKGTLVKYIVHTDLGGTLPSTVIKLAVYAQAEGVNRVRNYLDAQRKKGVAMRPINYVTNYSELATLFSDITYGSGESSKENTAKPSVTFAPSTTGGGSSNNASSSSSTASSSTSSKSASSASSTPAEGSMASKFVVNQDSTAFLPRMATNLKYSMKVPKLNIIALLIILLPSLLYVLVNPAIRVVAFLGGLLIVINYMVRLQLGKPETKTSEELMHKVAESQLTFRFPIDLGRILVYIDSKRSESNLDITFTHIVVKACAMAISEIPSLNGHVLMNQFYRSKTPGVDISLFVDVNERSTATVKIADADAKPTDYIADEIIEKVGDLRSAQLEKVNAGTSGQKTLAQKVTEVVPYFLVQYMKQWLFELGNTFGVNIPKLGISPYPYGVCTVVVSPDAETDVDLTVTSKVSSAPIVVTMGGLRIVPSLDSDRKLSGSPVLNFGVTINNQASSLTEARSFIARLQKMLNDPNLVDNVHQKALFEREEKIKRKKMFGEK